MEGAAWDGGGGFDDTARDDDGWCEEFIDELASEPGGVTIFAVRSSCPGGVGGETVEAGDVEVEWYASGVSGEEGDMGGVGGA